MDTGQLNIMSANSFSKSEFDLCKPYRKKKKKKGVTELVD